MPTNSLQPTYAQPIRIILTLAVAPAIGLGICRFAYALVLPDMRESLGWSYSLAGFMNTLNACGYLAGALGAGAVIRRYGMFETLRIGAFACVFSLVVSAMTSAAILFGTARFVSGAAAALTLIAGGALAANVAQGQAKNQAFYLSLFYTGPAAGIILSGLIAPVLLEWLGPGSWWVVWAVLALLSVLAASVLTRACVPEPPVENTEIKACIKAMPIAAYLAGYFVFGAGYIAYMTFMIAYVRSTGGGAAVQGLFWVGLGAGALAQPWVWGKLLAQLRSGGVTALLTLLTAAGAIVPFVGRAPAWLLVSALIFGNAFFAVVSSTAAFARYNYVRGAWPKAIAMMTLAFSIGQAFGPVAIGVVTDRSGNLSLALIVSAGLLVLSAMTFCCQTTVQRRSLSAGISFRTPRHQ
jgi:predicted MFS family arabinose efflux permease